MGQQGPSYATFPSSATGIAACTDRFANGIAARKATSKGATDEIRAGAHMRTGSGGADRSGETVC